MESPDEREIQFGELREREPDRIRSPLTDEHYCCLATGPVAAGDLPVFVDLDVFCELEDHAAQNTRVELGGVLLGRQSVDEQGQPLVLILDSLRAEHYEATRGSFKFTHSTWSEITRRRARMNDTLEIVGWYHTHPGWGVFLSDMDDFICRNFFSRPLDVALVIDPRQGTRGWFQWDPASGDTRPVAAWYLISHRHRALELQATVASLTGPSSQLSSTPPPLSATGAVAMMNRPSSPLPSSGLDPGLWALVWLTSLQTLVLVLVSWKAFSTGADRPGTVSGTGGAGGETEIGSRLYRQLAVDALAAGGHDPGLVDRIVEAERQLESLRAADLSHQSRIRELDRQLADAVASEKSLRAAHDQLLAANLRRLEGPAGTAQAAPLEKSGSAAPATGTNGSAGSVAGRNWRGLAAAGIGLAVVVLAAVGWLVLRKTGSDPDSGFLPDPQPGELPGNDRPAGSALAGSIANFPAAGKGRTPGGE